MVCPKCHSVYEDCIEKRSNGPSRSRLCKHVAFPKHPQLSRRTLCNTLLLKKIRTKYGVSLQPIKVYPFKSIKSSLAQLASSSDFLKSCELWRERTSMHGYESLLGDVYDGDVWKGFNTMDFLKSPFCYLVTLNVDWFQPFERDVYSVGAIYLTIQNLPRNVRYKPENILLVGILPGPSEAHYNINSYLSPLVAELEEAWNVGFTVMSSQRVPVTIRLALSCVSCDIPASRKVSGFLSHNASLGCNKCLKKFQIRFGQPSDFSGYDRENWTLRTMQIHRSSVQEVLKENTKTGIAGAESRLGVRYSVLLNLPYFDPVRFTVIDVMHNLFLGTGKKMFDLWIDNNLLTRQNIEEIEDRISLFNVPTGVGRLPSNIGSRHGGFTAKQWKNWILIYSVAALKGILPSNHMGCWLLFVRACKLLCQPIIKKEDIFLADKCFIEFCRKYEDLFGKVNFSPNMHLHLHLKDCLLDFGPPHGFWCFAFERFNGILGSYHTNKKAIECQLMKKFLTNQSIHHILKMEDQPLEIYPMKNSNDEFESHVQQISKTSLNAIKVLNFSTVDIETIHSFGKNSLVKPFPPLVEKILEETEFKDLMLVLSQLYPCKHIAHMSRTYQCFSHVCLGGSIIGSTMPGGNSSSSVITAYWAGSGNRITGRMPMRVGVVEQYLLHTIHFEGESDTERVDHVFAYVKWKKTHPNHDFYGVTSIVSSTLNEIPAACCFVPVQRICNLAAHAIITIDFGTIKEPVFVTTPIPIMYYL